TNESLSVLYNNIVINEKSLKFEPSDDNSISEYIGNTTISRSSLKQSNQESLKTPYTNDNLRRRLTTLYNKSRTVFEEQGYPILYLALGFIAWSEPDHPNKLYKAPLILVPVELIRHKVGDNYTLKWTGDDPISSLSLSAKLSEQGVTLPVFEMSESVNGYIEYVSQVQESIFIKGWEYIPEISLDLFSFRKYVMFKDLDPESWEGNLSLETHPLISELFNPSDVSSTDLPAYPTNEIDICLPSENSYNIIDADSSQIAVIEEAKQGKNLVVEGAPGTGKSQTIANLIVEMLVSGKTVLFVSEKMAALEVVKRRLDLVGLSRFCLELHSHKIKKADIIYELERCSVQSKTSHEDQLPKNINIELNHLRNELDEYCKELSTPIGNCSFTPYDLFGICEQYRIEYEQSSSRRQSPIFIPDSMGISPEQYKESISVLQDIESILPLIVRDGEDISQAAWYGCNPGLILPSDQSDIQSLISKYIGLIDSLLSYMGQLSDKVGITVPKEDTGVPRRIESGRILVNNLSMDLTPLNHFKYIWDNPAEITRMISKVRVIHELRQRVLEIFKPDIFTENSHELYTIINELYNKSTFYKLFSSKYKTFKSKIARYYKDALPSDDIIFTDVDLLHKYVIECNSVLSEDKKYKDTFGNVWVGEET
ncbi:MAG TPA: DUF4011 domain-containing protein, partial [Methanocorpusculum sp.]|nr:DUF4011 domain-containing protein [Methanocorpusculum sp.]